MAENFDEVVESLAAVTKLPAAGRAKEVLAVQIVDNKGKVQKAGGAAAKEKEREKLAREKKQLSLLQAIATALTDKDNGDDDDDGENGKKKTRKGGLKNFMSGMLGGMFTGGGIKSVLGKAIGPAALLTGLVMAIKDGVAGYFKSGEWGVSKLAGTIGGLFGGIDKGLKGALWGGMKWALIGAGIGSFIPVIGTAIGGAIGALLGALLGWIGGEKIAKWIDKITVWFKANWVIVTDWVKDVAIAIKEWIVEKFNFAKNTAIAGWTTLQAKVVEVFKKIKEWFEDLWKWSSEKVVVGWKGVTTFMTGVWDDIVGWFIGLWTWVEGGIVGAWKGVTGFIKGVWDKIVGWFTKLWEWSSKGIVMGWEGVTAYITGVYDDIVGWFIGLWTWVEGGIVGAWKGVTGFIKGVWDTVVGWFTKLWEWGENSGTKIAKGFKGITGFVTGVFDDIVDWFTGLFGFGKKDGKEMSEEEKKKLAGDFDLSKIIKDIVKGIGEFFWHPTKKTGILQFDFLDDIDIDLPSMKDISAAVKKFVETYIWKPSTGPVGIGDSGDPAVLFGIPLAFPSLPFPSKQDILDILPEWMTDPVGVLQRLITNLTKYLPSWLGGPEMSEADILAARIADLEETREKHKATFERRLMDPLMWKKKDGVRQIGDPKFFARSKRELDIERAKTGPAARWREGGKELEKLRQQQKEVTEASLHKKSIYTRDEELYERLERIFPTTESGQRAAAMMQANIQKSVDGLRQAGAQGSVNIQANSPVTTTVTQTQGRLARAPLDTASGI